MTNQPINSSYAQIALDKINHIENNFPVHSWKVNDLEVWPFIRTALAYSQNTSTTMKKIKVARGNFVIRGIKKISKQLHILIFFPFNYIKVVRSLKTSSHMFLAANTHCSFIGAKLVNKYFDTKVKEMRKDGLKPIVFDNSMVLNSKRINRKVLNSLPVFYMAYKLKSMLKGKTRGLDIQIEKYDEFYAYLSENFVMKATFAKAFRKDFMIKRLETLYGRKEFLKRHLTTSKIRYAYFLCYYSSLYYPLIAACNELGIITVDIQHGGIGRGHYCYDKWLNHERRYDLLPKYFWAWDEHTAKLINEWAVHTNFHKALCIGNPWLDTVLDNFKYDIKAGQNGYVLYNMNEVTLDKFIVEAMKLLKNEFIWMLRMHPRSYFNKETLAEQISNEGLSSYVFIEDTLRVPLPISILKCSFLISKASGSIIEAIAIGCKPLLLRSPDLNYCIHYVDADKAYLLEEDSSANLTLFLTTTSPQNISNEVVREDKFKKFEQLVQTN